MIKLRYSIEHEYDYETNSVIIILQSEYMQKEYPCANLNNLQPVLGHALVDFNEMHSEVIEDLQDEQAIEKHKAKKAQSNRSKRESE